MSQKFGVLIGLVLALVLGGFSLNWYCKKSTYTKAKGFMEKGYQVLAYETMMAHKDSYVKDMESCEQFIRAAVATGDANKIAWVSESCHSNGVEQWSTFMGLALAQKNRGNIQGAINLVAQTIQKFEKQPDPYYLLSKFFAEVKNNDQAEAMLFEAYKRAEDNANLAVEALQVFVAGNKLDRAMYIIERLKTKQINNPEVLLLMAVALKRAGKAEDSRMMVTMADQAMKDAPAGRVEAIRNQFAEVYAPDAAPQGQAPNSKGPGSKKP